MPRTRTRSGAPAQRAVPVAGQTYGLGVEQQRLQQAMPAPQLANQPAAAAPVAPSVPARAREQLPAPAPTFDQAMAAAQQMSPDAGLLTLPTQRPNEPVTHGLPLGPGGGPEVLGQQTGTPVGQWMRRIAMQSGLPYMQDLADKLNA